ncbi:hypothetical protein BSKO_09128 [Bryopsis sp. KO-2023]|nr:hypothetical protein BSKO_09128 [Bryopsis sp. KO-2023]
MQSLARRLATRVSSSACGKQAIASLVLCGHPENGAASGIPSGGVPAQSRASSITSEALAPNASGAPKQESPGASTSLEEALIERGLEHVKSVGWSHEALHLAAKDMGLSRAASSIVSEGPASLILRFISKSNAKALRILEVQSTEMKKLNLAERLSRSLRVRLELNVPFIERTPQAMKILANPSRTPKAGQLLHEYIDEVWHINGDRSMDMTWYLKRTALCGIYAAAEIHMLTDFSPGYGDTWEMIDARVKNLFDLQRLVTDGSSFLDMTFQMAKAEISKRLGFEPKTS